MWEGRSREASPYPDCVQYKLKNTIKKIVIISVFVLAIAIGLYHLRTGIGLIVILKGFRPFPFWVFVISGPLSTLPAVLTALLNKRLGSYWLLAGGFLSLGFTILWTKQLNISPFLIRINLPMLTLGLAFLGMTRINKENSNTNIMTAIKTNSTANN